MADRFGEEGEGTGNSAISGKIKGSHFTCPENAIVDKLSAYIWSLDLTVKFKAAIYEHVGGAFVAGSIERTLELQGTHWRDFTFASPPELTKGVEYWLVVWAEGGKSIYLLTESGAPAGKYGTQTVTYSSWPGTFSPATYAYVASIYCEYTVKEVVSGLADIILLQSLIEKVINHVSEMKLKILKKSEMDKTITLESKLH